jgi:hypothetical protein
VDFSGVNKIQQAMNQDQMHSFDELMVEMCLSNSLGDRDGQPRHAHVLRSISISRRMLSRLCKWCDRSQQRDGPAQMVALVRDVGVVLLGLSFSSRESKQVII